MTERNATALKPQRLDIPEQDDSCVRHMDTWLDLSEELGLHPASLWTFASTSSPGFGQDRNPVGRAATP